jgi:hypothetical protein
MPDYHPSLVSYSTFEQLPLLVLETIFEYVASNDWHGRGIAAISLTSKYCHESAARERLQRINFELTTPSKLEKDIAKRENCMQHGNQHKFVRHMHVTGDFEQKDDVPLTRSGEQQALPLEQNLNKDGDATTLHQAWQLLAHFVAKCQGLRDLVWESFDQIPYCVLHELHHHLPRTRLHVRNYHLRSMYRHRYELDDIEHDDYALASSPNLYSINASCAVITPEGEWNYNEEAVLDMVKGLAPCLLHVDMHYEEMSPSPQLQRALKKMRHPRRGGRYFIDDSPYNSKLKASLSELTIQGMSHTHPARLRTWQGATDFTKLRVFNITTSVEPESFEILMEMANAGAFKRLREFSFRTCVERDIETDNEERTAQLVAAFPSLEALKLDYCSLSLAQRIIQHPGPTLSKLHLDTICSLSLIQCLHTHCLNLSELQLSVRRTQGDKHEVAIYHALGQMSKLSRLNLSLEHSDPEIPEYTTPADVPRMSFALRNSAIDSTLAQSIFRVIFHANRTAIPSPFLPSFSHLRIHPTWPDSSSGFAALQKSIARSFDVVRRYADLDSDDTWIEEIVDERMRSMLKEELGTWHGEDDEDGFGAEDKVSKEVWQDIWPDANETEGLGWVDVWHSFPLVGEGG